MGFNVTGDLAPVDDRKKKVAYALLLLAAFMVALALLFPNILAQTPDEFIVSNDATIRAQLRECSAQMSSTYQQMKVLTQKCEESTIRVNKFSDNFKYLVVGALVFSSMLNLFFIKRWSDETGGQ